MQNTQTFSFLLKNRPKLDLMPFFFWAADTESRTLAPCTCSMLIEPNVLTWRNDSWLPCLELIGDGAKFELPTLFVRLKCKFIGINSRNATPTMWWKWWWLEMCKRGVTTDETQYGTDRMTWLDCRRYLWEYAIKHMSRWRREKAEEFRYDYIKIEIELMKCIWCVSALFIFFALLQLFSHFPCVSYLCDAKTFND